MVRTLPAFLRGLASPRGSALLVLALALARPAAAYPSFVSQNPNGNRTGVDAIGHVKPTGGGARNQYGMDFYAAGLQYTALLCQMDSDGDGWSNGMELGDPCCVWTPGDTPAFTEDISQPGSATSVPQVRRCEDVPPCSNGLQPACPSATAQPTPTPPPMMPTAVAGLLAGGAAALAFGLGFIARTLRWRPRSDVPSTPWRQLGRPSGGLEEDLM
jgi:hypothetical protein